VRRHVCWRSVISAVSDYERRMVETGEWEELPPGAWEDETDSRPNNPEQLHLEVRKLQQQGLPPQEIIQALGLSQEQARQQGLAPTFLWKTRQ
jgi:hypothetical protein